MDLKQVFDFFGNGLAQDEGFQIEFNVPMVIVYQHPKAHQFHRVHFLGGVVKEIKVLVIKEIRSES